MRVVVWLVLLFVLAVVAATTLGTNDGLVSFYWSGWRLDVSLNLFLLALIAGCFVLVTTIQGVRALVGLPQRAREWRVARRDRSAQEAL
ncbi:MAG TPA: heme biosynthesis HemY N-terminal domain-containing protein, partial [Burkholderiaceae bacterium]